MKSTPGPWKVGKNHPKWPLVDVCHVDAEEGQEVCTIYGPSPEEAEANARLISAAPELLDALKDLVDAAFESGSSEKVDPDGELFYAAKQAIARAEGKDDMKECKHIYEADTDGHPYCKLCGKYAYGNTYKPISHLAILCKCEDKNTNYHLTVCCAEKISINKEIAKK